jgi:hypothetical protein
VCEREIHERSDAAGAREAVITLNAYEEKALQDQRPSILSALTCPCISIDQLGFSTQGYERP